jgi:hypothetical protein
VERVALADDHVDGYLFEQLDPNQRVDTDLDSLLGESRRHAAQSP